MITCHGKLDCGVLDSYEGFDRAFDHSGHVTEYSAETISPLAPFDSAGVKGTRLNMLAAPGRVLTVLVGRERSWPPDWSGLSRWIDLDAARIALAG
jgi:hypothetical protein